jgi:hypothetical protein
MGNQEKEKAEGRKHQPETSSDYTDCADKRKRKPSSKDGDRAGA